MKMAFCYQCMRKRPLDETVCPACGYAHGTANVLAHTLKPETILDGRYLLGNVQKQDSNCIFYAALDLQSESVVSIKENFPRNKTIREGMEVIWSVPIDQVQELLVAFQNQNKSSELFLENGTIYSVEQASSQELTRIEVPELVAKSVAEVPDKFVYKAPSAPKNKTKEPKSSKPKNTKPKSGKKNGGKKRGLGAVIAIACILALVLGWCGMNHMRGNQAMEQEAYADAIAAYGKDFLFSKDSLPEAIRMAGEKAFADKDYAAAESYFAQLGEEGEARKADAIYEQANQLVQDGKYEEAILKLEPIASEKRAAELTGVAQLEIAKKLYSDGKTKEAIELAKSIQNTAKADVVSFLNQVYMNEADILISRGDYKGAVNAYKECVNVAEAKFNLSVLEDLMGGKPYQAAKSVAEQKEGVSGYSKKDWLDIFEDVIKGLPAEKNLDERLNRDAAIALLEEPIDFFAESYAKKFDTIFANKDMVDGRDIDAEETFKVTSMDDLYSKCGTAPAGKILIVLQSHDFSTKATKQVVSLAAMDLLPAEYRPASLSEVEYVAFIDYDYTRDGTYTGGTAGVKEHAKITIYKMPAKKSAASSGTLRGPGSPYTMYYYGTRPTWYSGGAPNVSSKLVELLKKVM